MEQQFKRILSLIFIASFVLTPILQTDVVTGWEGEVDKFVVCEGIATSGKIFQPVNVKNAFLTSEPVVYAYLLIKEVSMDTIKFEWIEPDGDVYATPEFKPLDKLWRISPLNISTVFHKIGKWTINAYANDELISSLNFDLMPPEPLLTVVNITTKPTGDVSFYIGNTRSMTYTLKNVGGEVAKQVRMAVEDLTPSEGLSISILSEAKDLASMTASEWTVEFQGEKSGTYRFNLALYLGDDRLTAWNGTIDVNLPELNLLYATINPKESKNIHPDDVVTVTYAYRNTGKSDAKQVGISLQVPEELELISVTPARDVMAGEDVEYIIKLKAKKGGEFEVNVTLNSFGYKIQGGEITIGVSPNPFYTQIPVIIGIATLISAIVAIVIIKRRFGKVRKRKKSSLQKTLKSN